jgi:hypothetical protein
MEERERKGEREGERERKRERSNITGSQLSFLLLWEYRHNPLRTLFYLNYFLRASISKYSYL